MSELLRDHTAIQRPQVHFLRRPIAVGLAFLIGLLASAWAIHHLAVVGGAIDYPVAYPVIFTILFILNAQQLMMSWFEKPFTVTPEEVKALNQLNVVVVVPVYNEDMEILAKNLFSLLDQTRMPNKIVVVNDGSKDSTGEFMPYNEVRQEWELVALSVGVHTEWLEQSNAGKRRAQVAGFRYAADSDVIITVDSDSVLDREAIREGLKPFANTQVQSVAGVNIGINSDKNLLTRMSDLLHIQWQLVARSAQNARKRITVNSGRLAFYRSEVCIDNLDAYLNEEFFGARVEFSDDSMLTMYAMERGLTVQQPTSITFTWHPENVPFLVRQRVRWMKGWFVRSFWRFRYLPLKTYAFWSEAIDVFRLTLGSAATGLVFIAGPLWLGHPLTWTLFVVPVVMTYLSSLRYLTVWRSDQSGFNRFVTFALSPLILAWCWCFLRPLRVYAMLTCRKTGWGTRGKVEVAHELDTEFA